MVPRDDLIQYLNDYLQVDQVKDYCPIGLQVEGKEQVHRIVTAVSAGAHLFQQAAEWQADMIIVHHGLFWDRDPRVVRGPLKSRLKTLLQNDITLLGYHLALDKHPVLGNNALAAQALGLEQVTPLGEVGVQGRVVGLTIAQLTQRVEAVFQHAALVFDAGPVQIKRIGFCSGSAARDLSDAVEAGLDAFITGEAKEETMNLAEENAIHFIAAGHYATERMGIRALGEHLARVFPVQVRFFERNNPV